MRLAAVARVDLDYARLERRLVLAEQAGDDVKVNLIAQQMAALEADAGAALFDEGDME